MIELKDEAPNCEVKALGPRELMDALQIANRVIKNGGVDMLMKLVRSRETGEEIGRDEKMRIGLEMFSLVTENASDTLYALIARVRGQSIEEFEQEPAVEMTRTIAAIMTDERNADFFTSLRSMFAGKVKAEATE